MPEETRKRGLFVTFEGIDGCGKSTQSEQFLIYLRQLNKFNHVLLTREPYKSRETRQIMQQETNPYSQARKLAELFIQDRKEHVAEIIAPNLEKGLHIISDRYMLSTLAYQSIQGLSVEELVSMHEQILIPDITFIIDVTARIARERMKKTDRREQKEPKFESDTCFIEKLRKRYLEVPKILPKKNIFVVDGKGSIDEVTRRIIDIFNFNINL